MNLFYKASSDDEDPALIDAANLFRNLAQLLSVGNRQEMAYNLLVRRSALAQIKEGVHYQAETNNGADCYVRDNLVVTYETRDQFTQDAWRFIEATFSLLDQLQREGNIPKKDHWQGLLWLANRDLPVFHELNGKLAYWVEQYRLKNIDADTLAQEVEKICQLPDYPTGDQVALKDIPLFRGLDDKAMAEMARVIEVREYNPGDFIARENEAADALFILAQGSCIIAKQGQMITVVRDRGLLIGEAAANPQPLPRSASVIAETKASLFRIDRKDLTRLLEHHPRLRVLLQNILAHKQAGIDQQVLPLPVFSGINPEELRFFLADKATIKNFKKGEVIIDQGKESPGVFALLRGSVMLTQVREGVVKPVELISEPLTQGIFGEGSIVFETGAACNVIAQEEVEVLFIARSDFLAWLNQFPQALNNILAASREHASSNNVRAEEVGRLARELHQPVIINHQQRQQIRHFVATHDTRAIFFLGAPKSGKTTMARSLVGELDAGWVHLVFGEYVSGVWRVLLNQRQVGDEQYEALAALVDRAWFEKRQKGEDLPLATIIILLNAVLALPKYAKAKGLVIDGFPRNKAQWEALSQGQIRWKTFKLRPDLFIFVDTPTEVLLTRNESRGREYEDQPHKFAGRIDDYEQNTRPMIDLLLVLPITLRFAGFQTNTKSPEHEKEIVKARMYDFIHRHFMSGQISKALAQQIVERNQRYIVVFGRPGAGKGKATVELVRQLNLLLPADKQFTLLVMGDIFRAINRIHVAREAGAAVNASDKIYEPLADLLPNAELEKMRQGRLCDDAPTITLINAALQLPPFANSWGIFLDGFPRTLGQLKAIEEAVIVQGKALRMDLSIILEVADEAAFNNLVSRAQRDFEAGLLRPDAPLVQGLSGVMDNSMVKAIAQLRMDEYHAKTAPMTTAVKQRHEPIVLNGFVDGISEAQSILVTRALILKHWAESLNKPLRPLPLGENSLAKTALFVIASVIGWSALLVVLVFAFPVSSRAADKDKYQHLSGEEKLVDIKARTLFREIVYEIDAAKRQAKGADLQAQLARLKQPFRDMLVLEMMGHFDAGGLEVKMRTLELVVVLSDKISHEALRSLANRVAVKIGHMQGEGLKAGEVLKGFFCYAVPAFEEKIWKRLKLTPKQIAALHSEGSRGIETILVAASLLTDEERLSLHQINNLLAYARQFNADTTLDVEALLKQHPRLHPLMSLEFLGQVMMSQNSNRGRVESKRRLTTLIQQTLDKLPAIDQFTEDGLKPLESQLHINAFRKQGYSVKAEPIRGRMVLSFGNGSSVCLEDFVKNTVYKVYPYLKVSHGLVVYFVGPHETWGYRFYKRTDGKILKKRVRSTRHLIDVPTGLISERFARQYVQVRKLIGAEKTTNRRKSIIEVHRLEEVLKECFPDHSDITSLVWNFARMPHERLRLLELTGVLTAQEADLLINFQGDSGALKQCLRSSRRELIGRITAVVNGYEGHIKNDDFLIKLRQRLVPWDFIEGLADVYGMAPSLLAYIISIRPGYMHWLPQALPVATALSIRTGMSIKTAWDLIHRKNIDGALHFVGEIERRDFINLLRKKKGFTIPWAWEYAFKHSLASLKAELGGKGTAVNQDFVTGLLLSLAVIEYAQAGTLIVAWIAVMLAAGLAKFSWNPMNSIRERASQVPVVSRLMPLMGEGTLQWDAIKHDVMRLARMFNSDELNDEAWWNKVFTDRDAVIEVLYVGEAIKGFALAYPLSKCFECKNPAQKPTAYYMVGRIVDPKYRSRGLGKVLWQEVISTLASNDQFKDVRVITFHQRQGVGKHRAAKLISVFPNWDNQGHSFDYRSIDLLHLKSSVRKILSSTSAVWGVWLGVLALLLQLSHGATAPPVSGNLLVQAGTFLPILVFGSIAQQNLHLFNLINQAVEAVYGMARKDPQSSDEALLGEFEKRLKQYANDYKQIVILISRLSKSPLIAKDYLPFEAFKLKLFQIFADRHPVINRRTFLQWMVTLGTAAIASKHVGGLAELVPKEIPPPVMASPSFILQFNEPQVLGRLASNLGGKLLSSDAPPALRAILNQGALSVWRNEASLKLAGIRSAADNLLLGEAMHLVPGVSSSGGMLVDGYPDVVHAHLIAEDLNKDPRLKLFFEALQRAERSFANLNSYAKERLNNRLAQLANRTEAMPVDELRQELDGSLAAAQKKPFEEYLAPDYKWNDLKLPSRIYLKVRDEEKGTDFLVVLADTSLVSEDRRYYEFITYEMFVLPLPLIIPPTERDQLEAFKKKHIIGKGVYKGYVQIQNDDDGFPVRILNEHFSNTFSWDYQWLKPVMNEWFEDFRREIKLNSQGLGCVYRSIKALEGQEKAEEWRQEMGKRGYPLPSSYGEVNFLTALSVMDQLGIKRQGHHVTCHIEGTWHMEPKPFEGSRPLEGVGASEIKPTAWIRGEKINGARHHLLLVDDPKGLVAGESNNGVGARDKESEDLDVVVNKRLKQLEDLVLRPSFIDKIRGFVSKPIDEIAEALKDDITSNAKLIIQLRAWFRANSERLNQQRAQLIAKPNLKDDLMFAAHEKVYEYLKRRGGMQKLGLALGVSAIDPIGILQATVVPVAWDPYAINPTLRKLWNEARSKGGNLTPTVLSRLLIQSNLSLIEPGQTANAHALFKNRYPKEFYLEKDWDSPVSVSDAVRGGIKQRLEELTKNQPVDIRLSQWRQLQREMNDAHPDSVLMKKACVNFERQINLAKEIGIRRHRVEQRQLSPQRHLKLSLQLCRPVLGCVAQALRAFDQYKGVDPQESFSYTQRFLNLVRPQDRNLFNSKEVDLARMMFIFKEVFQLDLNQFVLEMTEMGKLHLKFTPTQEACEASKKHIIDLNCGESIRLSQLIGEIPAQIYWVGASNDSPGMPRRDFFKLLAQTAGILQVSPEVLLQERAPGVKLQDHPLTLIMKWGDLPVWEDIYHPFITLEPMGKARTTVSMIKAVNQALEETKGFMFLSTEVLKPLTGIFYPGHHAQYGVSQDFGFERPSHHLLGWQSPARDESRKQLSKHPLVKNFFRLTDGQELSEAQFEKFGLGFERLYQVADFVYPCIQELASSANPDPTTRRIYKGILDEGISFIRTPWVQSWFKANEALLQKAMVEPLKGFIKESVADIVPSNSVYDRLTMGEIGKLNEERSELRKKLARITRIERILISQEDPYRVTAEDRLLLKQKKAIQARLIQLGHTFEYYQNKYGYEWPEPVEKETSGVNQDFVTGFFVSLAVLEYAQAGTLLFAWGSMILGAALAVGYLLSILMKSAGLTMRIPWYGFNTSKSSSPVTIILACPLTAISRTKLSLGSLQSEMEAVGWTNFPLRRMVSASRATSWGVMYFDKWGLRIVLNNSSREALENRRVILLSINAFKIKRAFLDLSRALTRILVSTTVRSIHFLTDFINKGVDFFLRDRGFFNARVNLFKSRGPLVFQRVLTQQFQQFLTIRLVQLRDGLLQLFDANFNFYHKMPPFVSKHNILLLWRQARDKVSQLWRTIATSTPGVWGLWLGALALLLQLSHGSTAPPALSSQAALPFLAVAGMLTPFGKESPLGNLLERLRSSWKALQEQDFDFFKGTHKTWQYMREFLTISLFTAVVMQIASLTACYYGDSLFPAMASAPPIEVPIANIILGSTVEELFKILPVVVCVYLLSSLESKKYISWAFWIGSSLMILLWALIHFEATPLYEHLLHAVPIMAGVALLWLLMNGFILQYMYWRSSNILLPIFTHIATNLLTLLYPILWDRISFLSIDWQYAASLLGLFSVFVVGYIFIWKTAFWGGVEQCAKRNCYIQSVLIRDGPAAQPLYDAVRYREAVIAFDPKTNEFEFLPLIDLMQQHHRSFDYLKARHYQDCPGHWHVYLEGEEDPQEGDMDLSYAFEQGLIKPGHMVGVKGRLHAKDKQEHRDSRSALLVWARQEPARTFDEKLAILRKFLLNPNSDPLDLTLNEGSRDSNEHSIRVFVGGLLIEMGFQIQGKAIKDGRKAEPINLADNGKEGKGLMPNAVELILPQGEIKQMNLLPADWRLVIGNHQADQWSVRSQGVYQADAYSVDDGKETKVDCVKYSVAYKPGQEITDGLAYMNGLAGDTAVKGLMVVLKDNDVEVFRSPLGIYLDLAQHQMYRWQAGDVKNPWRVYFIKASAWPDLSSDAFLKALPRLTLQPQQRLVYINGYMQGPRLSQGSLVPKYFYSVEKSSRKMGEVYPNHVAWRCMVPLRGQLKIYRGYVFQYRKDLAGKDIGVLFRDGLAQKAWDEQGEFVWTRADEESPLAVYEKGKLDKGKLIGGNFVGVVPFHGGEEFLNKLGKAYITNVPFTKTGGLSFINKFFWKSRKGYEHYQQATIVWDEGRVTHIYDHQGTLLWFDPRSVNDFDCRAILIGAHIENGKAQGGEVVFVSSKGIPQTELDKYPDCVVINLSANAQGIVSLGNRENKGRVYQHPDIAQAQGMTLLREHGRVRTLYDQKGAIIFDNSPASKNALFASVDFKDGRFSWENFRWAYEFKVPVETAQKYPYFAVTNVDAGTIGSVNVAGSCFIQNNEALKGRKDLVAVFWNGQPLALCDVEGKPIHIVDEGRMQEMALGDFKQSFNKDIVLQLIQLFGITYAYRILMKVYPTECGPAKRKILKYISILSQQEKDALQKPKSIKAYFKAVREVFKALPQKAWEANWLAAVITDEAYNLVSTKKDFLEKLSAEVSNQENPSYLRSAYRKVLKTYQGAQGLKASSLLKRTPRLFQKVAIDAMVRNRDFLLADQCGLGKTFTAIAAAVTAKPGPDQRILVICTNNNLSWWGEEILDSVNCKAEDIYIHKSSSRELLSSAKFVVINYEAIRGPFNKLRPLLLEMPWEVIIVDEAHSIRNDSWQAQAVMDFYAEYKFLLSATPVFGRKIKKIFPLLHFMEPDMFSDWREFSNDPLTIKSYLAQRMLCRLKSNICADLSPLRMAEEHVILSAAQRANYDRTNNDFLALFNRRQGISTNGLMLAKMHALRKATHAAKRDKVMGLAKEIMAGDEKCIIFSGYLSEVKELNEQLSKLYPDAVLVMTGNQKGQTTEILKAMRSDPKKKILIVTYQFAAQAMNLQFASRAIFVDFMCTFQEMEHAMGRIHRMGQQRPSTAHWIIAKDTIDEVILSWIKQGEEIHRFYITDEIALLPDQQAGMLTFFKEQFGLTPEEMTKPPAVSVGNKAASIADLLDDVAGAEDKDILNAIKNVSRDELREIDYAVNEEKLTALGRRAFNLLAEKRDGPAVRFFQSIPHEWMFKMEAPQVDDADQGRHKEKRLLTILGEMALIVRYWNGDEEAGNQLIISNERWVYRRAQRHLGRGVDMESLLASGRVGLARAIEAIDPRKYTKLITYATLAIDRVISRDVELDTSIHVPVNIKTEMRELIEQLNEYNEKHEKNYRLLDDDLSPEFLAKILKVYASVIIRIRASVKAKQMESLDEPMGEDDDETRGSRLVGAEDKGFSVNKLRADEYEALIAKIDNALKQKSGKNAKLRRRKIEIFLERCLNQRTLEDVGEEFGITRERVRQIEGQLLKICRGIFKRSGF